MANKVFICHSSTDHEFVMALAERLKNDSLQVWIDDWEIKVGDSIIQKINEGLQDSSFFIIVFSETSIKSEWVRRELSAALMKQLSNKDIKILPILLDLDPSSLPPLMMDIKAVKFQKDKISDSSYTELLKPIKNKQIADTLREYQDIFFENVEHIDIILKKRRPTRQEVEFLLNLIRQKKYEDYFFKKVTSINWFDILNREEYFSPEQAPGPEEIEEEGVYRIPQWNVLPYLERVSEQVNIPGNEKYIGELLDIIRNVTQYHIEHGKKLDNYYTWYYFVKILLNIPNNKIQLDIIDLIPVWLDSKFDATLPGTEIVTKLLPKFLTDNPDDIKKAEKIIEYVTALKTVASNQGKTKSFVIDSYWLKEAFKRYSETIGEKCSINVIKDLSEKIKTLLENKKDGAYRSFYDEPEYLLGKPVEILTFILKRVLLAKVRSNFAETKEILRNFFKDEYLYFPKMALFIIGQNIDRYSGLFWEIMSTKTGVHIMANTLYFGDELRYLLEHLKGLTEEQRKILAEKIDETVRSLDFKEDQNRLKLLHKQEIYKALSNDSYFKNLYEKMKQMTKVDVELGPAIGKVETQVGPGLSPLTKEKILKMPNDKIARFLASFKTKDLWRGPTVGGLADVLKEAVKEKPEKFIEDLNPFLNTYYLYVYKILDGIKEAWNEKKLIEWSKLLNFIEKYINREDFWNDKFIIRDEEWPASHANHRWVVASVAELLQEGAKNDIWAFPEEYFDQAKKIIFLMLEKLTIEENKEEIHDFVTHALNSAFGKVITALIFLALRIARVNKKKGIKEEVKWSNDFRDKYNELLKKGVIEAYTLLGQYMANLYYLDKEWVKDKIKELKNKQGTKCWEAFMDGYLFGVRVYDELYRLMKSHYLYSIEYNFKERHMEERLIQHIAIEYLRGHEDIDDTESLFKKVLDTWKTEYIKEIISFFWIQRDYKEDENIKEKIINFWRWIYENKYKEVETLTKEDKEILSDLSKLTVFLPKIDNESFNWLMTSAPYVHVNFNSPFFIEYLDNLKDKDSNSPKYVGKIFLKMLESFTPDYDQKHIRSIVENLYNSGQKAIAGKICNIYGSRGYEFLRDIYKKHQE